MEYVQNFKTFDPEIPFNKILEISPKGDHWILTQLYDTVAQRYRCGDVIRVVDKWQKLEAT